METGAGGQAAEGVAAHPHGRRQGATADTAHHFQGEEHVFGGLAVLDAQSAFQLVQDAGEPLTKQPVPRQTLTMCLPRGDRLKAL